MHIQNLVTLFVILREARNVMIMLLEFEHHRKDITKMMSHRNSVFADTLFPEQPFKEA